MAVRPGSPLDNVDNGFLSALSALDEELAMCHTEWLEGPLRRGKHLAALQKFDDDVQPFLVAIANAPDSFAAHFALAHFADSRNRHAEALPAYERSLELARRQGCKENLALVLNNLGVLLSDLKRRDESRRAYDEALIIRRQLAERDPYLHLPDLAETLNNLGTLLNEQDRTDEARQAYDEALAIRRPLAATDPDAYLPAVAATLHNRAILDLTDDRWEPARKTLEEALGIRRHLAKVDPAAFADVASTLTVLAVLDAEEGRIDLARREAQEALALYAPFVAEDPEGLEGRIERIERFLDSLDAPV